MNNKVSENDFLEYVKKLNNGLTTSELASVYGFSGKKFNMILSDVGIQYKRRYNGKDKWILKKEFQNKGFQESGFFTYRKADGEIMNFKKHPKWTKKGICYIYYYLKKRGIEPIKVIDDSDDIEEKIEQLSFV